MGNNFAYMGRQKRITIDGEDYYIDGEKSPVAIILCASKSKMMTELLGLDNSNIHVAEYLTKYVPTKMLEQKLLDSIKIAKAQMEQRKRFNNS